MTDLPAPPDAPLAAVIDLAAHRAARRAATTRTADPVRYITPEFVAAMQGSWGDLRPYLPRAVAQL